jgi:hypothetical protein
MLQCFLCVLHDILASRKDRRFGQCSAFHPNFLWLGGF